MLFRTHVVFAIACWFLLDFFVEVPAYVFVGVLLGAVFVDLDSCRSRVGRRFWFLSWVFGHRGFLHSLVGCFVFSAFVGLFDLWFGFGFGVGYVSHLVLDVYTKMGVALFWPLGFRVRGFVKSGSWLEDVVFVLLLLGDLGIAFYYLFWMI